MSYMDYLAQAIIALRKAKEHAEVSGDFSFVYDYYKVGYRGLTTKEKVANRIARFEEDLEKYYQFLGSI